MKLSEADIERTITDVLALDGWRSLKTDPVSRREWGKGFGEKGMADRLYIRYLKLIPDISCPDILLSVAQVMWIEHKSPTGRAAPHQKAWHAAERARGALVLVAGEDFPASIDGFMEFYRRSGLMRRKL